MIVAAVATVNRIPRGASELIAALGLDEAARMSEVRHDWTVGEALELLGRPFHDLLADAHVTHRERFDPHAVEGAMLLSIKTGGCPEDCAYCPQSARYKTGVEAQALMPVDEIVEMARRAEAAGATRFCLGAAWRSPTDRQVDHVA